LAPCVVHTNKNILKLIWKPNPNII
jgi:hypothetical protein